MKKSRVLLSLVLVASLMSLATASYARVKYYYFASIENCGGGGGWVVVSENSDGSAHINILCDGGTVG
jgi:hypothetical protein